MLVKTAATVGISTVAAGISISKEDTVWTNSVGIDRFLSHLSSHQELMKDFIFNAAYLKLLRLGLIPVKFS